MTLHYALVSGSETERAVCGAALDCRTRNWTYDAGLVGCERCRAVLLADAYCPTRSDREDR